MAIPVRRTLLFLSLVAVAAGVSSYFVTRELTGDSPQAVAQLRPGPPQQRDIGGPRPDFSNKVLHWQSYSYSFDEGSPDSANGKETVGDVWLRVGPGNKPVVLRGTFRFTDGAFHQEYLYVDGREIIVYDRPVLPPDAPVQPATPCRQESALNAVTFNELVDTGEPFYIDRGKIASEGFKLAEGQPTVVPSLKPAEFGATPEQVIGASTTVNARWVKEEPAEGEIKVTVLELDADTGRLHAEAHSERLADGAELTHTRFISTAVEVFAAGDVPTSVFSAETLAGGC